jgi:hypothetical protein
LHKQFRIVSPGLELGEEMLVGMELKKLLLLVVLLALETLPLIRFFIYFPTLGLLTSTTKAIIWIWNIWLNGWITIKKVRF